MRYTVSIRKENSQTKAQLSSLRQAAEFAARFTHRDQTAAAFVYDTRNGTCHGMYSKGNRIGSGECFSYPIAS